MNAIRPGLAGLLAALMLFAAGGHAATEKTVTAGAMNASQAASSSTEIAPPMTLVIGKSTILRLPAPAERISVGNPVVADITLINPREAYLLGKEIGSTNLIIWSRGGVATVIDVTVNIDAAALQARMRQLLPDEPDVSVDVAYDSVVLKGEVSDAVKMDQVMSIADAFVRKFNRHLVTDIAMPGGGGVNVSLSGGSKGSAAVKEAGARIVNMMQVRAPQQVMLEVKVAEVSKTLLDKLGAEFKMDKVNGSWTYSIVTDFLSGGGGVLSAVKNPFKAMGIDAEKQDGLVKILAEPNIMALSGQTGKFLSGGRIYVPVSRDKDTITLEEKEFGVRLAFTPTVLGGGRINLKVAPEVSEIAQTGNPFTTISGSGLTSILPSFTVRNAETTVQLIDGQSFAIAGLIKNNTTQTVKRFPVLGEIPILGALFRSSEFQDDKTELLFVITPRLVKPLPPNYALPTDHVHNPTRSEYFLEGKMEGSAASDKPASVTSPSNRGGFEMR